MGLEPAALSLLRATVLPELTARRLAAQQAKPGRKRSPGGGRRRKLYPYQEVLLTLVYLRHNVAHAVVGQESAELTPEQKAENQHLARQRVYVEHGVRRVKAWRIMRGEFRLGIGLFSLVASATVGLAHLSRIAPG